MKKFVLLIPLLVAALACTFSVNTFPVSTATPTAVSQYDVSFIPPQASFTFTPNAPGNLPTDAIVTGRLSYPSEFIPPIRVVLFSLTDGKAYFVHTARNQTAYSLRVPAGTYYVVSYPYEGSAGDTGIAASCTRWRSLCWGPYPNGSVRIGVRL